MRTRFTATSPSRRCWRKIKPGHANSCPVRKVGRNGLAGSLFSRSAVPNWPESGVYCASDAAWTDGWTLEKQVCLLEGENTVVLSYTLLGADRSADLELRPLFALRAIHELMYQWNGRLGAEVHPSGCLRIPPSSRTPEVFFAHDG